MRFLRWSHRIEASRSCPTATLCIRKEEEEQRELLTADGRSPRAWARPSPGLPGTDRRGGSRRRTERFRRPGPKSDGLRPLSFEACQMAKTPRFSSFHGPGNISNRLPVACLKGEVLGNPLAVFSLIKRCHRHFPLTDFAAANESGQRHLSSPSVVRLAALIKDTPMSKARVSRCCRGLSGLEKSQKIRQGGLLATLRQ